MIVINRTAFLNKMNETELLKGQAFTSEDGGHQFVITCRKDGEDVALTGTVTGRFIRADGVSVQLTPSYAGITSDGKAWVILPANCYTVRGQFALVIFHTDGDGHKCCIYSAAGYVRDGVSDQIVDPENVIDVDAVQGMIEDLQDAIQDAQEQATSSVQFTAQSLTDAQKEQARANIGAGSEADVSDLKSATDDLSASIYTQSGLHNYPFSDAFTLLGNFYFNDSSSSGTSIKFSYSGSWRGWYMYAPKAGTVKVTKASTYKLTVVVASNVTGFNTSASSTFTATCSQYTFYADGVASGAEISVSAGDLVFVSHAASGGVSKFETDLFVVYDTLSDNFKGLVEDIVDDGIGKAKQDYTQNVFHYTDGLTVGRIKDDGTNSGSDSTSAAYLRSGYLEIARENAKIYVTHESSMNFTFWFFDGNKTLIDNKKTGIGQRTGIFPLEGAKYFRYQCSIDGTTPITPDYAENFDVFQNSTVGNLNAKNQITWCALGDSISQGWISYINDGVSGSSIHTELGWVRLMADNKNWTIRNEAIGGTGYVRGETNSAPKVVKNLDFSSVNLVTLAYGVNDWKGNYALGSMQDGVLTDADIDAAPSTVVGNIYKNMRYCIEKILSDNPYCKIIVITPINCSAYGTREGNWGIGYPFANNGTLEDIYEAEKEICEYYGIELLDMTHSSIVNRQNADTVLADGVHPTGACHAVMAREIAAKIGF